MADFSRLGELKGLFSSLFQTFLPIIEMLFIFMTIIALLVGTGFFLYKVFSMNYGLDGMGFRKKRTKSTLAVLALIGLFLAMAVIPAHASPAMTLGSDSVQIGTAFSIQATGLTKGSTYAAVATHSDGNITRYLTASSSSGNFDFMFDAADTDGIVECYLYAVTAGAIVYTALSTIYIQTTEPEDYISGNWFLLLLVPMVLIGITLAIVAKFKF